MFFIVYTSVSSLSLHRVIDKILLDFCVRMHISINIEMSRFCEK